MATRTIASDVAESLRKLEAKGLVGTMVRTLLGALSARGRLPVALDEVEQAWVRLRHVVGVLEREAREPRSIGSLHTVAEACLSAGQAKGEAAAARSFAESLTSILDAATVGFDEAAASDDNLAVAHGAWRDGRRELWTLVERAREHYSTCAGGLELTANALRRQADERVARISTPRKGVRQRLAEAMLAGVAAWEGTREHAVRVEVTS